VVSPEGTARAGQARAGQGGGAGAGEGGGAGAGQGGGAGAGQGGGAGAGEGHAVPTVIARPISAGVNEPRSPSDRQGAAGESACAARTMHAKTRARCRLIIGKNLSQVLVLILFWEGSQAMNRVYCSTHSLQG
jgi:hypothetical protein